MAYYDFKAESTSGKAYYLGTYASGTQINVASKYSNYSNLTSANFVIQPDAKSIYSENIKGYTHHFEHERDECEISCAGRATFNAPTINYNPATGGLSFTLTLYQWCGSGVWGDTDDCQSSRTEAMTAKVYLLPEIEAI